MTPEELQATVDRLNASVKKAEEQTQPVQPRKPRMYDHHYPDGETITIDVVPVSGKMVDTKFGPMALLMYQDKEGRRFKYQGRTFPLPEENGRMFFLNEIEYMRITGTVKLVEFTGKDGFKIRMTELKKIKILDFKLK